MPNLKKSLGLFDSGRTRNRKRPTLFVESLEGRALLSHVHVLKAHPKPSYIETNLVSNDTSVVPATNMDSHLKNAWGIAASPAGPFWIADNGTGSSTLYNGTGTPQSLVVKIPSPAGNTSTSAPTGIVFNSSTDFAVSTPGKTAAAPSLFLFSTEDGTISGWSPKVNSTNAILAVDHSASGAVYKGLALASSSSGNRLYATNFRAGTVEVFDSNFNPASLAANAFQDSKIPKGYAPFGIANVGGNLMVTFAKQNSAKHDDTSGKGHGFVDLFSPDGSLISRVARRGTLNSPWGIAVAPSTFGKFANDLLIGDFGDGRINAFKIGAKKTTFAGQLNRSNGKPITIPGLWGLEFGNGGNAGSKDTLFFTAGPNGEQDGLFGSLTVNPSS